MKNNIGCNVFLIGFMGAGKSTIARALKERTGLPVVEMDERIVKEQGMSINDIFAKYGEDHFRDIESQLLLDLGKEEHSIISCGGGAVIRSCNIDYMKQSGKIIYLKASPESIYERVKNSTDRPILNGHMNVEYIAGLMENRRALYEAAADVTIQTDKKTKDAICREIMDELEKTR